jgi:sterol desaturase/sphingolipid hydroxylase (fatty acid hydroxylase superfamily)
VLTAALMAALVFVPALVLSSASDAEALTLGVAIGYLAYSLCHHATHHWRAKGRWLKERKRWHAIHHVRGHGECYGVTSKLWDLVFGTGPNERVRTSGGAHRV